MSMSISISIQFELVTFFVFFFFFQILNLIGISLGDLSSMLNAFTYYKLNQIITVQIQNNQNK